MRVSSRSILGLTALPYVRRGASKSRPTLLSTARDAFPRSTIWGWKKRDWKTADNKAVKNADLWQQLDAQARKHKISWHWVRGHAGHPENERADELARKGLKEARDMEI